MKPSVIAALVALSLTASPALAQIVGPPCCALNPAPHKQEARPAARCEPGKPCLGTFVFDNTFSGAMLHRQPLKVQMDKFCSSAKALSGFDRFWLDIKITVDFVTHNDHALFMHQNEQFKGITAMRCMRTKPSAKNFG
jgi:hypothetical protein